MEPKEKSKDSTTAYMILKAFNLTFKNFAENSTLCGYRYLTEGASFQRLLWFFIHTISLVSVIYLNLHMWNIFLTNPTIVTLEKFTLPIREISFPGVSVCALNRISKAMALETAYTYAEKSSQTVEWIMSRMKYLGKLYDYDFSDDEEKSLLDFQKFLEMYSPAKDEKFNVLALMKRFSVPCEKIISECRWAGLSRNCGDLFITELTQDGYCCVFNYVAKSSGIYSKILLENGNQSLHSPNFGKDYGLSFTVFSNLSNYIYSTLAATGIKVYSVLFSNPEDFPDLTSGSLIEKLVPIGTESNLEITAKSLYTVEEARKYSVEKRNCIFKDEVQTIFGSYSRSDCIMECKIRSVLALCECIGFMHVNAWSGDGTNNDFYQCNLADLPCLSKHSAKWRQLYPNEYPGDDLEKERQDSLACNFCYPECNDTLYFVNNEQVFLSGENLNYSIVNIFFESPYAELHKQDVVYYWYDMISLFGGICSLIMGVSIISLVEIIVFFTYKLFDNYRVLVVKSYNK